MFEFEKHHILLLGGSEKFRQYPLIDVEDIYFFKDKLSNRKFKLYEHLPFIADMKEWYGNWAKRVREYDTFIILDGIRGGDVIEFIKEHNQHARIILYYVNSFGDGDRNDPRQYKKYGCEIYTFDRKQAQAAGIGFHHYYYEYEEEYNEVRNVKIPIKQDVLFIGMDKGRMQFLQELDNSFNEIGITFYYRVVPDKRKRYSKEQNNKLLKTRIPYKVIAQQIQESKAVLDINSAGQSGITLRPMECLFFGKKLITNNDDVVNYDFFNEDNVFLLNKRNFNELPLFMKTESYFDNSIRNKYTKEYWMESFFV